MAQKDSPEEIFKAFQLFDMDKTGKISFANLKEVWVSLTHRFHPTHTHTSIPTGGEAARREPG